MKKPVLIIALFATPILLSACDKPNETSETGAQINAIGDADISSAPKQANGSGTVIAIDKAAGKITIDHGPIAEHGWPSMKMGFNAAPELLSGVTVGDAVDFTMSLDGTNATVTVLTRK